MDSVVKQCIEGRKLAFENSYEITDENLKKKIDELFKKINELGEKSTDAMDFETKFASSPLNSEYTNLFTEISTSCECIIPEIPKEEKKDKSKVLDEVASEAKYIADDITMPMRRKAREEFDRKMRDTPLGKLEQMSNTASVFKRIFKK